MKREFIIDTDTASDDAVALLMALLWPDVEVLAVTVVSGNVALPQAVINALYTVELAGSEAPVYMGADRPLLRPPVYAHFYHGRDGMGEQNYPPPRGRPQAGKAEDVLVELVDRHPGLTLVTLGPLTNIALALKKAPHLAGKVGRCVVMGGAACTVGNVTPAAEFNIWCDPEAARMVFRSGLPIEMVGWELCRGPANLLPDEIEQVLALGNPLSQFVIDCNRTAIEANLRQCGDRGLALPDPVAMAVALAPDRICKRSSLHYVDIETESALTRGMTVVDALGVAGDERNRDQWGNLIERPPNVRVCWEIDIARWKEMLMSVLQGEAS